MYISARMDQALRALMVLARQPDGESANAQEVSDESGMTLKVTTNILADLRRNGLVLLQRGHGYRLRRSAAELTIGEVLNLLAVAFVDVSGAISEPAEAESAFASLGTVWFRLRDTVEAYLDSITIADLVAGDTAQLRARIDAANQLSTSTGI